MRTGMPRRTMWWRVADGAAAQRLSRARRARRCRHLGRMLRAGVCVLAVFASACEKAARSPVQPSDPSAPVYVGVSCGEGARFIGEAFPCSAYARDSLGLTRLIGFLPDCLWASRDPSIVGLHPTFGGPVFVGIAGGSAEVTATYKGVVGSTRVVVEAVDGIKVTAWTSPTARVGTIAVLRQEVCHSLVTATSGRVVVRAVVGNGTIAESSREVGVGGSCEWRFLEFTVPAGASRVCRTVSLEFGSQRIDALPPPNAGDTWCLAVTN